MENKSLVLIISFLITYTNGLALLQKKKISTFNLLNSEGNSEQFLQPNIQ